MAENIIGQQIGNYRIVEEIGSGGFARVYRGEHVLLKERQVAIKFLHTYLGSAQERERFLQEARMLEKLRHHHILLIYDVGISEGFPYLVAEYAPHGSLRDRLKQGKLSTEDMVRILSQIAQALQFAHGQGIIHRDLKPENILFNAQGEALLADFGIATTLNSASFRSAQISGTPAYMAPEQFEGTISRESDQYALGCIGYEMITGIAPFSGDNMFATGYKHVHQVPPSPRQLSPSLPPHIEQAILTSMAKKREDRFHDLRDFISMLYGASLSSSRTLTSSLPTEPTNRTILSAPHAAVWATEARSEGPIYTTPPYSYNPPTPFPMAQTTFAMQTPHANTKKGGRHSLLIISVACILAVAIIMSAVIFAFAGARGNNPNAGAPTETAVSEAQLLRLTATVGRHGTQPTRNTPTAAPGTTPPPGSTPVPTATATAGPAPTATFTPTATATPKASETLTVDFRYSSGTQTTNSYSGTVTLTISGEGQASAQQYSDAFYRYTDTSGNQITNPGHPSCWDLWINDAAAEDSLTSLPGYSTGHAYTVTMNAPGGTINFKVCDTDYSDNTGSYTIKVQQN